jgi:hypothetical protein
MPTAILRTVTKKPDGNVVHTDVSSTITHNNARLYNASGRTYEYVGDDINVNRIYRDTSNQ